MKSFMNGQWKSIYVAGKMQDDDWRRRLFDMPGYGDSHPHKCNPVISFDTSFNDEPWPEYGETICGLRYTGPFFVDNLSGHGYDNSQEEDDTHGSNISRPATRGHYDRVERQKEVQQWCFDAIKRADLFVAWIDCIDCYGTIAEIGYAKALGKPIWIAGPRYYRDLWFVYRMADNFYTGGYPHLSLKAWITEGINQHRRYHREFDSPIEKSFWDAWMDLRTRTFAEFDFLQLETQFHIGRYRVDFANVETKTAVEMDGHATHSSTDAIAYDRKRQRAIEALGWHVVRFGGKEIFQDADACAVEVWNLLNRRYDDISKMKGEKQPVVRENTRSDNIRSDRSVDSAATPGLKVPPPTPVPPQTRITLASLNEYWPRVKWSIKSHSPQAARIAAVTNGLDLIHVEAESEPPVLVLRAHAKFHYTALKPADIEVIEWAIKTEFGLDCKVRVLPPGEQVETHVSSPSAEKSIEELPDWDELPDWKAMREDTHDA